MLQALLKIAIFAALARSLRPRWRGLLIAAFGIGTAFLAHAEYLSYVELTKDMTYLIQSYWYKWLMIVGVCSFYILFVERRLRSSKARSSDFNVVAPEAISEGTGEDPFEFLLRKEKLATRAERLFKESNLADD